MRLLLRWLDRLIRGRNWPADPEPRPIHRDHLAQTFQKAAQAHYETDTAAWPFNR